MRAHQTRRANAYNLAVRVLTNTEATPANRAKLQRAAHDVSEEIAAHLPEESVLPRGYRLSKNGWGEPAIALRQVLFNGGYTSPPPNLSELVQFAKDVKTGWVREVLEATEAVLHFRAPRARRT